MKKKLIFLIAIIALSLVLSSISFAQFGDLVNKAKDAAKKGKTDSTTSNKSTSSTQNEIGTIYFSNQPFSSDGSVAGAKTSFNSNEFIYGRLVLKSGTVGDVLKPEAPNDKIKGYNFDFETYRIYRPHPSSDLARTSVGRVYKAIISKEDFGKTYWDFDVLPNPSDAKSAFYWGGNPNDGMIYAHGLYLFMLDNSTKEGSYEIFTEIKIAGKDFRGNPLPESEAKPIQSSFKFNFRGTDFSTVKANSEKLDKTFFTNYQKQKALNEPLPAEWSAKSSPIIGGFTVASLSNLYVNSFSDSAPNAFKIIKFYAAPPKSQGTWIIQNNSYGIPAYRYSSQYYTVFVRDTRNGVCFYQGFGLRQEYSGGGTFAKTRIDHGSSAILTCDKMGLK